MEHSMGPGKTKPIERSLRCEVQNEANSSIADCGFGIVDCAKQSQTWAPPGYLGDGVWQEGPNVQNEPNLPGGTGRPPLDPPGSVPAKQIVQNEANSRFSGRADGPGGRRRMPAIPLPTTAGSIACQSGRPAVS
jgi:hypothetical protein